MVFLHTCAYRLSSLESQLAITDGAISAVFPEESICSLRREAVLWNCGICHAISILTRCTTYFKHKRYIMLCDIKSSFRIQLSGKLKGLTYSRLDANSSFRPLFLLSPKISRYSGFSSACFSCQWWSLMFVSLGPKNRQFHFIHTFLPMCLRSS